MNTLKYLFAAALLSIAFTAQAQNAREASVKFNKAATNAIIADYQYNTSIITQALSEKLTKDGLGKSKSKNGYQLFSGVNWSAVSSDKVDVYYKVDGKKDNSTVILLISKGYDNFINSTKDAEMVANAKNVLNNLVNEARIVLLQQQITDQTKVIKTSEDKCVDLKKQFEKLQSEKEKIEKEMSKNQDDQKKCESDVSAARQKLEDLNKQK